MTAFETKLNQTQTYFNQGDIDLGFRNLVDCVLDTQDSSFYKKTIDLVGWKEANPEQHKEFVARCNDLLTELGQVVVSERQNSREPLVKVSDLLKRYARSSFQIGPIDLELKAGEIWGLVGENGNGKTSLLRVLAKDLKFDSGLITFSSNLENQKLYEQRTQLTYIPQRTPKWHGSLKSNLKFTASQYGIMGEENELIVLMYIIRFGLWSFRNYKWSELSSGYKMRFELARTFLRRPQLLLLDEPLANLDVLAQQLILEDLKLMAASISNPIGIILSSQQLFEVEKIAHKVIFLKQGKPIYVDQTKKDSESLDANDPTVEQTILELDVQLSKDELARILSSLPVNHIQYNGGIFLIRVAKRTAMNEVLLALIQAQVQITYVRDISNSTRRFFIQNS